MKKTTANEPSEEFLVDCEPYFVDGFQAAAEFARRTQKVVATIVERRREEIIRALDIPAEINLFRYFRPDKLHDAASANEINLGAKFKSEGLQTAIYRYWFLSEGTTGVCSYIWIKGRDRLDLLSATLDESKGSWETLRGVDGTYYVRHEFAPGEEPELSSWVEKLLSHYIELLQSVGSVGKFLKP